MKAKAEQTIAARNGLPEQVFVGYNIRLMLEDGVFFEPTRAGVLSAAAHFAAIVLDQRTKEIS